MRALSTLLAAALLMGGSAASLAANDGQMRANELLHNPDYREAWSKVVKKQERLPEWVMNLSGTAEQQMTAVTEDGDPYLTGTLCETADSCRSERLILAASLDRKHMYGLLVEVPAGLPADKSPKSHATSRYLGEPDDGMQQLLQEELRKDPNWY
ncbi:inhibitor of vertebrate lysozyme family protein [Pseudomonas sp. DTU_2021_1001937_2_SI_NGA_ILE_001]|uniref:inhibitor of vertebrate lysozyme family protein n=1 Tax=Pseudomonas sp. DTU_2021_1001937_2_SI_NGA_ILE_001 TaxID=3077589 RepID=UPI0028FC301D|nr:inhibitor of vertebrate lysozyme family protein [Pseudomonas sp. DTU_2021_1001937_2_SI_NGA_ILE_001]WNW12683.1 inhibitor of vertebrate lysozyme family protein [Pseudomonas sp. DTU_2021_1001937_2_SI_NGA_ILE_001]